MSQSHKDQNGGMMKDIDKSDHLLLAKAKADRFRDEIYRLLNRFNPDKYSERIAKIIWGLVDAGPEVWVKFPPFFALDSIEINCVSHKAYKDYEINEAQLNKVMNAYRGFEDPYIEYVLRDLKEPDLFLISLSEQQMRLQKRPSLNDLARSIELFVTDNSLPNTTHFFCQARGYSMQDWITVSFSIYAQCFAQKSPIIFQSQFLHTEIKSLRDEAIPLFFDDASKTPEEIKDIHNSENSCFPSHLSIFRPSIFHTYPLIELKDGKYLLPHPFMIFNYATEGLYGACSSINSTVFLKEFSTRFESYVLNVLSEIPGKKNIFCENELKKFTHGKVCDYIVELDDSILLVECKATRYSSRLKNREAIENDNSTGKIADAFVQLFETAKMINNGGYSAILDYKQKPIVAMCIIYGQIDFVNVSLYQEEFIFKRMKDNVEYLSLSNQLKINPQTLDISTFEDLVVASRISQKSILDIFQEKMEATYEKVGDWSTFLPNYSINGERWELPFLKATINRFFDNLRP